MKKDKYGTPEMVKQFRKGLTLRDGEMPDFIETLKLMEKEGTLSDKPLPFPEITGLMSKEDFILSFDRIPFNATQILRHTKITEEKDFADAIFPSGKDVLCVQHFHDFGYREQPHLGFFSLTYIMKGQCNFIFGEKLLELNEGDMCIITPEMSHKIHAFTDTFALEFLIREKSFHVVFYDFLEAPTKLSEFLGSTVGGKSNNYCVIHSDPEDRKLTYFLQSLVAEDTMEQVYSNTCTVSLLKLFLSSMFHKYADTMEFYRQEFSQRKMSEQNIYQYIRNNYIDITLEQTAEYFHYNKTYLSRYMREHFGKTFMEIVTQIKIDHAREYLRNTDKHITEIARLTGYDTTENFSRMFRKCCGISPAFYRREYRKTISAFTETKI